MMDIVTWLTVVADIIIAYIVIVFLWVIGRQIWYWAAAKVMGWDEHEKIKRQAAWIRRDVESANRLAWKDTEAASNTGRRRMGVIWATLAIAALAWQSNLPWWEVVLIAGVACVGITMAAALAWRWR